MTGQSSRFSPFSLPSRLHRAGLVVAMTIVAAAALALFLAVRFIDTERQRGQQSWQLLLGVVADSRAQAIGEWLDQSFAALQELADNASLQLYMTELRLAEGARERVTDEPAQANYLRHLLSATADATGFARRPQATPINANVERLGTGGIGLIDADGRPLVASPGMPALTEPLRQGIADALAGRANVIDIFRAANGEPQLGFALPVFAVQGDGTEAIGAVVGVRALDHGFFNRLKQPGDPTATAETYLVRATASTIEFLSPLADGTPPLALSLARDSEGLAAAFAVDKPGAFAIKRDRAGRDVLVTSRPIARTPWILVRTIGRTEALGATDARLGTALVVFVLIIAGVVAGLIAVWRHGSSLRVKTAADQYRIAAERFENITKFLRVVTNGQPTQIVAVDGETRYTFANRRAAQPYGLEPEEMIGKTMASVIGPVQAKVYAAINQDVMTRFAACDDVEACRQTHVHVFTADVLPAAAGNGTVSDEHGTAIPNDASTARVIRSSHIPLRGDRDYPPAVLMVLDDITELTRQRQHSEAMLGTLIETLVSVVDRRDPFSANHSKRVAEVARCIAQEMGLPEAETRVVSVAGRLMNIGKIFVPAELLIKTDPLSEEEQTMLETIHTVSADLVRHVPFDGAVVPTIEQIGEWWDGSGPLQLRGEAILPTARIIAVANAFVGMVSPRAHRMPLSFEQAVQSLLGQTGVRFDRRPVSALIHYLVNRQGNQTWAHFQDQPAEPPFLHRSQASPAAAAAAGAPPAPQPAGPDRATVGILRRLPAPETKKPGDDDPKTAAAPAPAVTARRRC